MRKNMNNFRNRKARFVLGSLMVFLFVSSALILFTLDRGVCGDCSANRITYAGNLRKPVTVTLNLKSGRKVFNCWDSFQENALLDGRQVLIKGLTGGHPFFADPRLQVDKNKALCEPMVIRIKTVLEEEIFVPYEDSAVPYHIELTADYRLKSESWVMAIGVTWEFPQRGMKFKAGDEMYIVRKEGATIKFTNDGVVLDGLEKI